MALMHCFTLDGRYSALYGNHFVMLNHFHHGNLISFPFYLLLWLEDGIADFRRNPRNSFLHEGLMLLIFKHIKANLVIESPVPVNFDKSKKREKGSGKCQIEEVYGSSSTKIEEEFDVWLDGYHTDLDYTPSSGGKKCSAKKVNLSTLCVKCKNLGDWRRGDFGG